MNRPLDTTSSGDASQTHIECPGHSWGNGEYFRRHIGTHRSIADSSDVPFDEVSHEVRGGSIHSIAKIQCFEDLTKLTFSPTKLVYDQ